MTIRHHIIYTIAAAMLSAVALYSCSPEESASQEPDQPGETATVTFTINAAPLGSTSSRDDQNPNFSGSDLAQSEVLPNELIFNWAVAFFRGKEVVAVVDGQPGTGGGTSGASGVWNDRVTLELPRGTYSALAFANFDAAKIKDHVSEILNPDDWKNHIYDEEFLHTNNSLIPMSGYLENFTVTGRVNEEFAIEVVRMKAKIEFAVKNLSSQQVRVEKFSFTPVYTGSIYLFPEYDKKPTPDTDQPTDAPRLPDLTNGESNPYTTVEESAPTNFMFDANSTDVKRANFYIKESIAEGNHPTDHFHIGLTLKRGEEDAEDVTYALADDALKFIYRNDYILFPIVISDYVPEFEVIDFPPIGGYPVTVKAVNNQFYATFSSSGAFDISARLRNSQGQTVAIQPYDDTGAQQNYVRYLGSTPDNFNLTYEPTLANWQGNFIQGSNKHIVLKFEFKIGDLKYLRTLHLISN